ncbi:MAG TPA: ATP-binding protein [Polyangiaceae bacterium]|nr:ATP-binding protein [Polyangiaceae bacterium]
MTAILRFLLLPKEITDFERNYLSRVNRVALVFFALHVPAFALIAWLNGTGAKTAALLTLAVLVGPALAQSALKNPRWVSVVYGVTAMCMGGLLVHFGQGPVQIEMHFYFFALVAMCAVFGNPMVIVAAACTVAVHHLIVWLVLPQSVFNYSAAWWVVAVHAAFVVLESVATCFISRSFFDNVIGLEKIVQARTDELDGKNREMRLLLDNVQQGFLTIDAAGELARERSAAIDSWFGAPAADASWFDFLDGISPDFAARSRFGWEDVVAAIMPAEVTLAQMPQRLTLRGAHYQIDYRPIGLSEPYAHYLVIVTNVTVEMERERAEVERIESMAIFERVLVDRSGVEIFFEDANQIITALVHQSVTEPAVVKRLIHTLKGNTSIYGLSSLAQLCEQLEDFVAETSALPPRSMYELLEQRWARLASDIEKLLGKHSHSLVIDDQQFAELVAGTRAGESKLKMLRRLQALKLEDTAKRLRHFGEQAQRIASRLDKGPLRVSIEDHGVRLDPRRWSGFWSAFIHAIRNAVDHGVESSAARAATGKPAEPLLTLRTYEEKEQLVVEISDDGQGVDWDRVAQRASAAGLPTTTRDDLEHALFADGITTTVTVSDISGRGVGMGALLAATRELGGTLDIQTALGVGTTLRFTFPTSATVAPDSLFPASAVN